MAQPPRQCNHCIQTDAFPGITMDSEGVCSGCRAYEARWGTQEGAPDEQAFLRILERARRRRRKYDALVGISGGLDSCYLLHLAVTRFGMHVLAFTHDNGFLSDGARENIARMVGALGVEHRYASHEPELVRRLWYGLIKSACAEFPMVCTNTGISKLNQLVMTEDVGMVLLGFSPRTEPTFPLEIHSGYDHRFLRDALKPYVPPRELGCFKNSLPWMFYTTFIKRVRYVFLPEYVPWIETEMKTLLADEYGWQDYGHGKPHFDCLLCPAEDYFLRRRLGVSKVDAKLSQMIRCGQMTRDEALARLAEEDPVEEPTESIEILCERTGVTREDLAPYFEGTTKDYHHFKSWTALFHRFSWVFWLTHKLGFTSEDLYHKYR